MSEIQVEMHVKLSDNLVMPSTTYFLNHINGYHLI